MIDVVCYGLGPIGARIARRVLGRADLRIAGAVDPDPAKAGRDLADVLGLPSPTGLPVVPSLGELGVRDRTAVAVHATVSALAVAAPQLEELASRGLNVVSTCEQLAWPADQRELAARIDAAARAAGVSVIGSGINPGFLMDTLPLALTAACVRVEAIRVARVVDTNLRRLPLQQKTGVGMTVAAFHERAAAGTLGHVGLRQSAAMLAAGLGWTIGTYSETLDPVIAQRDTDTGLGRVGAGGVIGQRQLAIATVGGREAIRYELEMSAGAQQIDAIEIEGEPPIRQVVEGGVNGDVGTEAVIVNLVSVVSAAAPGLLTMRELYPLVWRDDGS
jgi:4-hydroxy-tetrahydrodipicolinate reductase